MNQESVVALIGPGSGPLIPTFGRDSVATVRGLNGGMLTIHTHDEERKPVGKRVVGSDGEFELPGPCYYMSVECHDADSTLIAQLVRG